MNQLGEPDDLYVRARRALLDAADALGSHLDAVVLVGAQALYMHTGAAELAVAEYTTDADFAIQPAELADAPLIADLLGAARITQGKHHGEWLSHDGIRIDLMVPEELAGPGTRGAELGPHGRRTARRAKGLEAAIIDRERKTIRALDPADQRFVEMNVAGPGALLVAKAHKIWERRESPPRTSDKDALDVLRLLRCIAVDDFAARLTTLRRDTASSAVTEEAIEYLGSLFSTADAIGVEMATRAVVPHEDPDVVAASLVTLAADVLDELMARTPQQSSN